MHRAVFQPLLPLMRCLGVDNTPYGHSLSAPYGWPTIPAHFHEGPKPKPINCAVKILGGEVTKYTLIIYIAENILDL
jgi:hypothetical protein